MLATIVRAAPRAARRLTTGAATRAPLAPPYEHAIRSSLAPPYAQHIDSTSTRTDRLQPSYAYAVAPKSEPAITPAQWVAAVLETEAGRAWAQSAWDSALEDLNDQPASPPEVPFQALTAVLADASMRSLLQRSGGIVVRDVVRDALAEAWAAELIAARAERSRPTFHSEAQIAARSDCSVLSATSQVLRSLTGSTEAYVRVDAVGVSPSTWAAKSTWDSVSTPLHAHLALARTSLSVPTSSTAAIYSLLRPHFAPKASRISFYSANDYLSAKNWTLRDRPDYDVADVHLRPASVQLTPGDVLITHAGLRIAPTDAAGLVLPVHPLPADKNVAFIKAQRAAYEAGLPPPHVQNDGLVQLEAEASEADISTNAGKRAMGYDV